MCSIFSIEVYDGLLYMSYECSAMSEAQLKFDAYLQQSTTVSILLTISGRSSWGLRSLSEEADEEIGECWELAGAPTSPGTCKTDGG